MNKSLKRLLTISFTILLVIGFYNITNKEALTTRNYSNLFLSIENIGKNPDDIYLKAWKKLKKDYYDETCNHQNWDYWKTKYSNKLKTKEDSYVAITTMTESLNDPYTRFLPPKEFKEQYLNIDAKLFGIGVNIAQIGNETVIVNVLEETPAEKSHLKSGDTILKVDGIPITGLALDKVAGMVRGEKGSNVKLDILRNKKNLAINITRDEIKIINVKSKVLDDKFGYIKISSFLSKNALDEMIDALRNTQDTKAIIIDLRGNHGGLLPNATYIADMFLNKGIIVSIVDRDGDKKDFKASKGSVFEDKPIAVLIDGASASASEILSGALKDNKRAVLVGEKTFGKGLVQEINQLSDGSGINITIAKYLTPNGTDIHHKGIKPDYQVKITEKQILNDEDPQLEKAKTVLNSQIEKIHQARK